MQQILLDTSAIYAIIDATDKNHSAAQIFLRHTPRLYFVPDTVFSEALTLIKVRLGVTFAIKAGELIQIGTPFRLHRLTPQEVSATWRIFSRYIDKEWSYTDCSILAVSRELGVASVFAFDQHFDQMSSLGLQRVP
jgi:uncharacterized protein